MEGVEMESLRDTKMPAPSLGGIDLPFMPTNDAFFKKLFELDMQYYELPKLHGFREGDAPLEQWLHFFKAKTKDELAIIESKGDWFMKQAVMECNALAGDEAFACEASFWEDRRRREESALAAEREYAEVMAREEMRREMQAVVERKEAENKLLRAEIERLKAERGKH